MMSSFVVPEGLYRTICLVALKTGMRAGELAGVTWADVDLKENEVERMERPVRPGRPYAKTALEVGARVLRLAQEAAAERAANANTSSGTSCQGCSTT